MKPDDWWLSCDIWAEGETLSSFEARRDTIVNPSSMYICTKKPNLSRNWEGQLKLARLNQSDSLNHFHFVNWV